MIERVIGWCAVNRIVVILASLGLALWGLVVPEAMAYAGIAGLDINRVLIPSPGVCGFGPTGVLESFRGQGVGSALLLAALFAMKAEGYAYAIIGGAGKQAGFYERLAGASGIAGSDPGGPRQGFAGHPWQHRAGCVTFAG